MWRRFPAAPSGGRITRGIEACKAYAVAAEAQLDRSGLLHGPKLDDDDGHASQDDVDAMFATG